MVQKPQVPVEQTGSFNNNYDNDDSTATLTAASKLATSLLIAHASFNPDSLPLEYLMNPFG